MRRKNRQLPLVSVVVPIYNQGRYLKECLESVLRQTVDDLEILVVDDCSDDDGPSIVEAFRKKYAGKIRLFHSASKSPLGAGAARNIGIRKAKGRFLAFVDADDLWYPFLLERQLGVLQSKPDVGFTYARMEYVDTEGRPTVFGGERTVGRGVRHKAVDMFERVLKENIVPTCTVVVPSRHLHTSGLFFESPKKNFEDWSLWCRLAFKHRGYFVPEVLAQYRIGHQSQSRDLSGSRGHLEAEKEWLIELFSHLMMMSPDQAHSLESLLRKQAGRLMVRARSWGASTSEIAQLMKPVGESFPRVRRSIGVYQTMLQFVPRGVAQTLRRFRRVLLRRQ